MSFKLHEKLSKDCYELGQFKLCTLLLMNDSQYPWFILVPKREGIQDLYQLDRDDQISFLIESNLLSRTLDQLFKGDKLNVAALGNVVSQLHIHHIVRFKTDPCWPKPVWGQLSAKPYKMERAFQIRDQLADLLGKGFKSNHAMALP